MNDIFTGIKKERLIELAIHCMPIYEQAIEDDTKLKESDIVNWIITDTFFDSEIERLWITLKLSSAIERYWNTGERLVLP